MKFDPSRSRLNKLLTKLETRGFDGVIFSPGPFMRYYLNYPGPASGRLILGIASKEGGTQIIAPKFYEQRAIDSGVDSVFTYFDDHGPSEVRSAIEGCFSNIKTSKSIFAVDKNFTLGLKDAVNRISPGIQFKMGHEELSEDRVIKNNDEIDLVKKASKILESAITEAFGDLRPGITEAEIKLGLMKRIFELGADSIPIGQVQTGSNSALPDWVSSGREIESGDMVVIDFPCEYKGYYADITRSKVIGKATEKQKKVHQTVFEAKKKAIMSEIRPGVQAQEIHRIANRVIVEAGFGECTVHITGHGLGLSHHEGPVINEGYNDVLREGMIFTVEPGIYIPGEFGVRLEDNVVVTKDGCEKITSLPEPVD